MQVEPKSVWTSSKKEKFELGKMTIYAQKGTATVTVEENGEIKIKGGKDLVVQSGVFNDTASRMLITDSEVSSIFTGCGKDIIRLHNCQFKDGLLNKSVIQLRGSNNELYVNGDLKGEVRAQQDHLFGEKEKADKIVVNGTNYADIMVDPSDKVKTRKNEGHIRNIVVVPVVC